MTRIFDLMYPRQCAMCAERLAASQSLLCAPCLLHIPLTGFEQHPYDNEMAQRFWRLIPIERAAALFYYEAQSDLARLIYQLKYYARPEIGEHLGRITAMHFAQTGFFEGIDAIVPVPLSRMRQWHRGYNQSMEIARGVSFVTGIPIYQTVVKRVNFKQSQTHLDHWQRQQNAAHAFVLTNADKVKGKHLLLIDDVVTTGATATALAQELLRAGDVRFSILSLGYTKS